jgi:hypothetical protein
MLEADALNVSAIEDLDPSLVDGATIIYDREVNTETIPPDIYVF